MTPARRASSLGPSPRARGAHPAGEDPSRRRRHDRPHRPPCRRPDPARRKLPTTRQRNRQPAQHQDTEPGRLDTPTGGLIFDRRNSLRFGLWFTFRDRDQPGGLLSASHGVPTLTRIVARVPRCDAGPSRVPPLGASRPDLPGAGSGPSSRPRRLSREPGRGSRAPAAIPISGLGCSSLR